jgi:hypothetical protein
MEAEYIVGICHQATTGEDIANGEDLMGAVVTVICEVCKNSESIIPVCSYVV